MTSAAGNRTLLRYLTALLGADDGGLLEVRARRPDGMSQAFYDHGRLATAAAAITRLGRRTDVYVGCAPRRRRAGHRDAIDRVWVLWADCDTPDALERLAAFTPAPAIVIRSGSASNAHAYWLLDRPVDADAAVIANRKLAHALGADSGGVTAATAILRPPGTRNHKHDPPRPVIAERLQLTRRTTITQLTGELPDPPAAAGAGDAPGPPFRERPAACDLTARLRLRAHRPHPWPRRQDRLPAASRQHPIAARLQRTRAGLVVLWLSTRRIDL